MALLLEVQNPEAYERIPAYSDLLAWANACWLDESDAGVVIRIVGEAEGRELNQSFRERDYATNILSFPYEQMPMYTEYEDGSGGGEIDYLGDLIICLPVIEREAAEQDKHPLQHWAHMVVHGLLHLQGFDHVREIEADIMEAREIEILKQLGFPNPYEPS
ncbi:MAG: rRNA maturation RNase YbeY [Thiolinea sp.]